MAISYEIKKHETGFPSNVLAGNYGEHMFSIKLTTDTDNGQLVAAGDWVSLDLFEEATVTKFEGKIVQKMNNGKYLVLVTDPGDALFVYENPIIAEEYNSDFKKLSNFYNPAGAVVRAYGLHKYDRVEVSEGNFSGTPSVGATISGVTAKKMTIA